MTETDLGQLTHQELADLAREYLLAGQMIDRAGMPHLISRYGREEMQAIAIEEWMGASPIYSRRMQRTLGFEGDDIDTMFKGMQLDIGAPPEFMDFRYLVHDAHHGEFWLQHCGALMDVEPMGDEFVLGMCHDIEDPTFDATACASNPHARMQPVHRPPRTPADRHPHCHWTVTIDPSVPALDTPQRCSLIASTLAAALPADPPAEPPAVATAPAPADPPAVATAPAPAEPPDVATAPPPARWNDYAHPMDPDMRMEDFSTAALTAILRESALQAHLLVASFTSSITQRHDLESALEITERQFAGVSGMTAERLVRARALNDGLDAIADVFDTHPAFHPRSYIDWHVRQGDDHVELELRECDATRESVTPMWMTLLADGHDRALTTIARAVNPSAVVERIEQRSWRWRVEIGDAPHDEDPDVALTKFSSGADFTFRRVGPRDSPASTEPHMPPSTTVSLRPRAT